MSALRPAGTTPLLVLGLALAAGLGVAGLVLPEFGPADEGRAYDVGRMVLIHATLPRLMIGLVAGAALGLAGALLQQVLRNPLAEPGTLGVSAGAFLALTLATAYAPALAGLGRDLVALAGSGAVAAALFGVTARRGFAPLSLILAGLVLSLWAGALTAAVILFNEHWLSGLFLWGAGSLVQQDWWPALGLLARTVPLAIVAALLARPIGLLDLDDAAARGLGLPVPLVRLGAVAVAVGLAAFVTSAVGVISFVGLFAPALARLCGARTPGARLLWSAAIGAALLSATDAGVQWLAQASGSFLPTGAVTALFGVPVLIALLPRLTRATPPVADGANGPAADHGPAAIGIGTGLVLVAGAVGLALVVGRDPDGGWSLALGGDFAQLAPWRAPRMVAAFAAGAMLAVAGTILQRLTRNPMASPEVTGIGAGAGLGLMAALFLLPMVGLGSGTATGSGAAVEMAAAMMGAALVLGAVLWLGQRADSAPERILLVGIGLGALADALIGLVMATGDPRGLRILRWMGGSTYGLAMPAALAALAGAAGSVAVATALHRWLDLLPLGGGPAAAVGVPVRRARLMLFAAAAMVSAAATLVVGPLSFAGLIAPHIARELGHRRAMPQILAGALVGGGLLVLADWLGRMVAFPYQLPAGLVSALVGAPFLLLLLNRRR